MPYKFVPDSFHTGVTAEALRAKIERKSTISHQRGHFDPKYQVEGVAPTNYFCTVTTLPLTVFTQRNFVADFLQAISDFFYGNRPFCVFRPPLGDLGTTYG